MSSLSISTSKNPKQPIDRLSMHLMGGFLAYSNRRDFVSASLVSKQWLQATRSSTVQQQLADRVVPYAKPSEKTSSLKRTNPETSILLQPLPKDLVRFYLTYLSNRDLISVSNVCREYSQLTRSETLQKVFARNFAFGAKAWETYFGTVDEEPPLPSNLHQLLAEPCPIFVGKRLREAFILTLLPTVVNGQPLTLMTFKALVEKSKQGAPIDFYEFEYSDLFTTCAARAQWVFLSRQHFPESLDTSFHIQQEMVKKWRETQKIPYALPTVLQATVSIISHCVRSRKRLYESDYVNCQERVTAAPIAIGFLDPTQPPLATMTLSLIDEEDAANETPNVFEINLLAADGSESDGAGVALILPQERIPS